ncbi:hypothetical protein [Anaeromyxobacter sp. Fw109-5]|uniref:hypothetical protein n=1 Tax=Anaeromyxobacter sp. (strain Fw109-5) TaxID=404589 RepID=UPI0000ED74BF|nr:hypothetical protein [Anaeromyxobacter sp. Fw109-5]ABS26537.1 conserved hypothetical protein [Anaeromyxobacter sp. Fw109-5]
MRRSDLALGFLAVAIAAALFVVVRGERRVTAVYTVPVEAVLAPRVPKVEGLPTEVTVAVNGQWARLRVLDPASLGPVRIDVTRGGAAAVAWHARAEALHLPLGLRVESITPAQGTIDLRRDVH